MTNYLTNELLVKMNNLYLSFETIENKVTEHVYTIDEVI